MNDLIKFEKYKIVLNKWIEYLFYVRNKANAFIKFINLIEDFQFYLLNSFWNMIEVYIHILIHCWE